MRTLMVTKTLKWYQIVQSTLIIFEDWKLINTPIDTIKVTMVLTNNNKTVMLRLSMGSRWSTKLLNKSLGTFVY